MKSKTGPGRWLSNLAIYAVMVFFAGLAIFPVALTFINAFKTRRAIFTAPLMPPTPETFSLVGFQTVFERTNFGYYMINSLVVTLVAMALIMLLGAMAAWALSEYHFRGNTLLGLYLAPGHHDPHPSRHGEHLAAGGGA